MMKKKFILFMLCTGLISGLFFTSCSSPSGTNPDNQNPENTTDNGNDKGDKLQSSQLSDKLKFDFSDATALFGLKEGDKNIYKLTSSGKIVPAFTWGKEFTEDGYTLSINNIYKSPISEDVIIQFNGYIHHTDLVNYKNEYLGPLVHVDKDGKINSPTVVQIDNYDKTLSIPFEETPTVKFDDNGVAYFIAYHGIFDDATNSKYALFSYNPSTKTRKQLLPYQEQFTYEEFYVINDGKCIILIEKEKSSKNYSVSAVPVHVPSQKITLLESGKDEIGNITYDKFSDKLYINTIYQESYRNYGLYYICTRNGDVFNIAQEPLASPEINIPHVFGRKSVKYGAWPNRYINYSTKEFKTDVFLEYLLKEFTHFSYNEKKCKLPTTENYYISFEKFKDIEEFKPIYEATKGKINEEAIAALDTGNLRTILLNAYTENGYYDEIENNCGNNSEVTLKHSLLADTLYDKNTGKLVSEDETEASKFFNYCNCGEKHFVIMSGCENRYIDNESGYYPEPLPEYLNSDGTINYTKILETFFNSCNVHGKKEFNLDYLETTNNKLFSTDKKNEEALQYVFEDIERACYFESFLDNNWTGFEDGTNYGKLFVIEGTTSPAFNVSFNRGQGWLYGLFPWIPMKSGIWSLYQNYDYYPSILQVMDNDGCLLNNRGSNIKITSKALFIENYLVDNDVCYLHFSIGSNYLKYDKDSIYLVDFNNDTKEDLLINISDSDDFNIYSWIVIDNKIYLSGTDNKTKEIINGYVDLSTKSFTKITQITDSLTCLCKF